MLQLYGVFAILLVLSTYTTSTPIEDCAVQSGTTVTCLHTIPIQLPDHTTQVYIRDWLHEITGHTFNHSTWSTVEQLDIAVLKVTITTKINFNLYNLRSLSNLRYLGYHSSNLNAIPYQPFNGLNKFRTLNMADCTRLDVDSLMTRLNVTDILPALDTLILDNVGTFYANPIKWNTIFDDVLYYKKIRHLSLHNTPFSISRANRQLMVNNLNVSKSGMGLYRKEQVRSILTNVKTLDISFVKMGSQFDHVKVINTTEPCNTPNMSIQLGMERLYANDINMPSYVNSYADISKCPVKMKVIHLAHNKIEKLNITIKWPIKIGLYEIDLSHNQMAYLSPAAFSGVPSMQSVFLSFNRLSGMENTSEVLELFQTFKLLKHLTLDMNGLSRIPEKMFQNNVHMKVLDLSGNKLTSVTFETKQFKALHCLKLSDNKISFIDANMRLRFDNLPVQTIDMSDNPFQCTCENVDSIRWMVAFQETNKVSFTCELEGKEIRMDNNALTDSSYQCHKTIILITIIISCIAGVVAICLLTFITVRTIRTRQRKDAMKRFVRNYRNGNIAESFLVLLSYSNQEDGDFVWNNIYPQLECYLRVRIRLDKDIVCIDDKHFLPGFSTVQGMMDRILDSCVVVFVISNSFCESSSCLRDVEEAYTRRKPVILIMFEDVDLAIMPAHVRDLFERYTRCTLEVDNDGQYRLNPSWTLLCQSILELASQKQLQQ